MLPCIDKESMQDDQRSLLSSCMFQPVYAKVKEGKHTIATLLAGAARARLALAKSFQIDTSSRCHCVQPWPCCCRYFSKPEFRTSQINLRPKNNSRLTSNSAKRSRDHKVCRTCTCKNISRHVSNLLQLLVRNHKLLIVHTIRQNKVSFACAHKCNDKTCIQCATFI